MRIGIVGSRDYPLEHLVRRFVRTLALKDPSVVILSGGAPGVDTWAEDEADKCGLAKEIHPADWVHHGRRAGMLRNSTVVRVSNKIAAFWDLRSRGTRDVISKAERAGVPCKVVGPTGRVSDGFPVAALS